MVARVQATRPITPCEYRQIKRPFPPPAARRVKKLELTSSSRNIPRQLWPLPSLVPRHAPRVLSPLAGPRVRRTSRRGRCNSRAPGRSRRGSTQIPIPTTAPCGREPPRGGPRGSPQNRDGGSALLCADNRAPPRSRGVAPCAHSPPGPALLPGARRVHRCPLTPALRLPRVGATGRAHPRQAASGGATAAR